MRASRSRCACGDLGERIALVDPDLDLAAGHDAEQLVRHRLRRLARRDVGEQRRAGHVERALRAQDARAERGHDARRVAEARHQPERAQAIERLVPGVLADRVVDHLDALPAGDLLDPRGEVLGAVVDREGRAVLGGQRALLVGARRSRSVADRAPWPTGRRSGRRRRRRHGTARSHRLAGPPAAASCAAGTGRSGPSASSRRRSRTRWRPAA